MSISVSGQVTGGFEPVQRAFEAAFDDAPSMGGALAIFVDGEPVANLWAGIADERSGALWRNDTPSVIFSCTKGVMSLLVARLVDEGRLDYSAPVARYSLAAFPQAIRAACRSRADHVWLMNQCGGPPPRSRRRPVRGWCGPSLSVRDTGVPFWDR